MTPGDSRPVLFIHTNDQQLFSAYVSAHSMRSRSRHADEFEIRLLRLEETPRLYERDGGQHLWNGGLHTWRRADSHSFMGLRRMVPQAMGFHGRALVIDPDVFALADVFELLTRDMGGKAILCKKQVDHIAVPPRAIYSSSVMLLDCDKLAHWQWDREIDELFRGAFDFGPWMGLLTEPVDSIGVLEEEWNHFDTLTQHTKLLHNTERQTQPWKTGLPVDADLLRRFHTEKRPPRSMARILLRLGLRRERPRPVPLNLPHPDPRQERLFFTLLSECLANGEITEGFLRDEIRRKHVRPDAFELVRAATQRN